MLRQAHALDTLVRCKECELKKLREKDYEHELEKMKVANEMINSEKQINEELTNYIEYLENRIEELEK